MPFQGVSSVLSGTHNYPSSSDPTSCSSFFDFERWEADNGIAYGSSRSPSNLSWSGDTDDQDAMSIDGGPQSDSRSIPDLVYANSGSPSDSGHPGSPDSPSADLGEYSSSYSTHLAHGKPHNGLYSGPQPELQPQFQQYDTGLHAYEQLNSAIPLTYEEYRKSSSLSSSSAKKTSRTSATKRPHGSSEVVSKKTAQRGRRSGPLCNKDEVAEVRALGACFRCKITKVSVCQIPLQQCGIPCNCIY